MQINGYGNDVSPYRLGAQSGETPGITFDTQMAKLREAHRPNANQSTQMSQAEEMAAFKQEIYDQINRIYASMSSAVLTNSIHITLGRF